ncbi:MAG: GTP-binding protein, partial [Candidatus Abyssobacteria bacterium SURF_17]
MLRDKIRNFCIIAHIDHGKSTLADRILELTHAVPERSMREQTLDTMDIERERGITIKAAAIRVNYQALDGEEYFLNLIDTPGHVDFSYEVTRSLGACEGALLLVDASQGVQAQTLANAYLATDRNLEIIPVINKIDLQNARVDEVKQQIADIIGLAPDTVLLTSAKNAIGIREVLEAVVTHVPSPRGNDDAPLKALIFDSVYDSYRGAIAYVRVVDGCIRPGQQIVSMASNRQYEVEEVGIFKLEEVPEWRSFPDEFENKPYIQKQQLYNWDIENLTWEDWAPAVARYYGIISQMDDAIGKLLQKLDDLGISDNTIVIYSTDHGDMCGGHRMMDKHYVLYDDVVRVPLVVRWPGVIKPGAVCSEFVYNFLDIQPTILEILGLAPKDFFHGRSMLPLLKGDKPDDWRKEVVSTYNGQQFGLYTQRMLRNDKWKYIWNTTDVDELYDMENDPDELKNLIHEEIHAPMVAEFRKKLYEELLKD